MKKKRLDLIRLLALLTIFTAIVYFYISIFAPRLIPKFFRIGVMRRPVTILVLGTDVTFDANTGEPLPQSDGRTDSIVLMRIDPVHYKLNILSIPRDSFVNIPGYGMQKINAANVYGGIELIKKTITTLTGRPIDYYLKVNPYATTKLVDLLGGINIYVEKDMYYVDKAQNLNINLKQGWQKLSGREAQGYIRFRHDAYGDIGRMGRQQQFLETLFKSFTKPVNLLKAPLAFRIAIQYVQTDLSFPKIIRLANFTRMLDIKDIRTFTATGEEGSSDYAGSILIPDKQYIRQLVKDYF